ncbi:MAG: SAM-dependent methyltransferase, partial [Anaeroplasmataceae bacterium]|nr:SAM-dependent methyltransferase [Anaeroplasmataceae bacterium]
PLDIIKGTFSIPYSNQKYTKAKLTRILLKNEEVIQVSLFTQQQVFHDNVEISKLNEYLNLMLEEKFKSLELFTKEYIYSYKISNKGKVLTNRKTQKNDFVVLEHNKQKKYLLEEGMIIPPLIDLGIMTSEGKVVKSRFDKFKQINRFLEMIEDTVADEKQLRIIDFGCGKSYLTFILYYFFTYIKKIDCKMIGLDLKADVIRHCNEIAQKYGYNQLTFQQGDISQFKDSNSVDMIVTLHACDTATDYALYYAIQMKCKYIFSVPCCQHEINLKLNAIKLAPISKYGILKDRFSAILTDSIRANILEYFGYKTNILEFVDWDTTPKNVLIRATLAQMKPNEKLKEEIEAWLTQLNVDQTLYSLCFKQKEA